MTELELQLAKCEEILRRINIASNKVAEHSYPAKVRIICRSPRFGIPVDHAVFDYLKEQTRRQIKEVKDAILHEKREAHARATVGMPRPVVPRSDGFRALHSEDQPSS